MTRSETYSDDLSEIYHALRTPRRRFVIQLLAKSDQEQLSIRSLSSHIAAAEENVTPERATGEPYRNVYNALSQTHLPCLSNTEIVRYDQDRQHISTGPMFELAVLFLRINRTIYLTLPSRSLESLDNRIAPSITD